MNTPKKRALVVVGAGASVEYGIPVTSKFTQLITDKINTTPTYVKQNIPAVYNYVKDALIAFYKGDEGEAHFERIYHVLHELYAFRHIAGAVPKHSPVMFPFFKADLTFKDTELWAACRAMIEIIYSEVSSICDSSTHDLTPLQSFFSLVEENFIPRVYTTNYDDFISEATGNRYFTGFAPTDSGLNLFDSKNFFDHWNDSCLYHLHGSIHMGFPPPEGNLQLGDLAWYEQRNDAMARASITASGVNKMDGTSIERTSIITGLEKLGRLQQNPHAFYYSEFARDAMAADVIFVIGSGLADLHLNKWLKEIRLAKPDTPLLYVGFWKDKDAFDEQSDLKINLLHDLRVESFGQRSGRSIANGWMIYDKNHAAVWQKGFQAFLQENNSLNNVLRMIGANV